MSAEEVMDAEETVDVVETMRQAIIRDAGDQ